MSSSQTVDLSPGAPPPIVRVSNLGATVNFIDNTGAPWDIVEVNNMAKGRFEVLKPVTTIPSITITADGDYVEGDVAVFLKDLPFPIVVKMVAGQQETDYRLDVRIPRRGPKRRLACTRCRLDRPAKRTTCSRYLMGRTRPEQSLSASKTDPPA